MDAPKYVVFRHEPGKTIGGYRQDWFIVGHFNDEDIVLSLYSRNKAKFDEGTWKIFGLHPVEFETSVKIKERR